MIKSIAIAAMMLVPAATPALAQGGPPQRAQQPSVLGQTGTMYDGNNANLQLPPEQNAYWARLWAQPSASGNSGPASAGRRRRRRHVPRGAPHAAASIDRTAPT